MTPHRAFRWRKSQGGGAVGAEFDSRRSLARSRLRRAGRSDKSRLWCVPRVTPMLLQSAQEPPGPDTRWAFETKWDGMRAICAVAGGHFGVWSKNGTDFSEAFPELQGIARALAGRSAILDGELVCFGPGSRPSFARIRRRWAPSARRRDLSLVRECPATLIAFDLLELDGRRVTGRPYEERRALLDELELADQHWLTTAYHVGQGVELLRASREQGLEGLVAKRLGSVYQPGVRSRDWLKLKNYDHGRFTIGGWGADAQDCIDALYVGTPSPLGLAFAGTVEFGLAGHRRELRQLLEIIAANCSPFSGRSGPRKVHHVQPRLEATVRFIGWDAGVLREAILEGVTLIAR
jgi:bifunctional non-homologous end joining protein LigD